MERETPALYAWLPVVFWALIIALESGYGSAANTGSILEQLAKWMFGYVDPARFAIVHHIMRKAGHFLGYGIFGLFWFRAFRRTYTRATPLTCASAAIACIFLIASLDEWIQSFSRARAGQLRDVVLDTFGALVLVLLALITAAHRRRPNTA